MKKSTFFFVFLLLVVTVLLALNYFYKPFHNIFLSRMDSAQEASPAAVTATPDPVAVVLGEMSVKEKISQLIAFPLTLSDSEIESSAEAESKTEESEQAKDSTGVGVLIQEYSDKAANLPGTTTIDWIKNNNPGFILIFGQEINFALAQKEISVILDQYQAEALFPLFAVDHEGGAVQRLTGEDFTVLPSWQAVCQQEDEAVNELFKKSAVELSTAGINVVFAPVLDFGKNNNVLKNRVCADAEITAKRAEQYILAFAQAGILPVVKHFPGIGKITKDPHHLSHVISLEPADSQIFQKILEKYPNVGVMTAHVALKDKLDNQVCSLSKTCLAAFPSSLPEVLIFTDALDMLAARIDRNAESSNAELKSLTQVAKEAMLAGNDVLVFGKGVKADDIYQVIDDLAAEYESNEEFERKVNWSLKKVLELKQMKGE